MNKKPLNFKSQDNETSRSILNSNSPRQNRSSTSTTKAVNTNGIFKRTSLYEAKSVNDVLSTSMRETRSDSATKHMDHLKGITRAKSPEKRQTKKVQFLDSPGKSDHDNENPFRCLLDCNNAANGPEFHNFLKAESDSSLSQIIDDKTDNLLDLLSEISPRESSLQSNVNSISKMTTVERISVILLIILFVIMILKHCRYDWLLPSSTDKPHRLTGSEIITLVGRNVKRMCKNLVSVQSYFWYSDK